LKPSILKSRHSFILDFSLKLLSSLFLLRRPFLAVVRIRSQERTFMISIVGDCRVDRQSVLKTPWLMLLRVNCFNVVFTLVALFFVIYVKLREVKFSRC